VPSRASDSTVLFFFRFLLFLVWEERAAALFCLLHGSAGAFLCVCVSSLCVRARAENSVLVCFFIAVRKTLYLFLFAGV
jgi:hypothetical protein